MRGHRPEPDGQRPDPDRRLGDYLHVDGDEPEYERCNRGPGHELLASWPDAAPAAAAGHRLDPKVGWKGTAEGMSADFTRRCCLVLSQLQ